MKKIINNDLFWDILFVTTMYAVVAFIIKPQTPAVFLLILFSLNLTVIHFRFTRTMHYMIFSIVVMFILAFFWPQALFLALPFTYLLNKEGKFVQSLVLIPFILIISPAEILLYALYGFTAVLGTLVNLWQKDKAALLSTIDAHKKRMFDIQNEQTLLLESQTEISRIATYKERDRIAQKLHDDLGHEITAGLLSLKAYRRIAENDRHDFDVLDTAIRRIELAASELKDTVHNTKPLIDYGQDVFEKRIEMFSLDVDYIKTGNLSNVPPYYWQVLNAILKESLTNALKHSSANKVTVSLEVTNHLVRLSVENNNPEPRDNTKPGYGLTFMRKRVEALGGALSLQRSTTFKIIAILPFEEEPS